MKRGVLSALGLGALALVLVALVAFGGAGVASADHANTTELHNSTVEATNDTTAVWVEVTNTSYNGTVHNVTATFYAIDENGNETQVDSVNLSADTNSTDYYEVSADPGNYSSYRVVVEGETAELVESGSIEKVLGGGGSTPATFFGVAWYWWLVVIGLVMLLFASEG